MKRLFARAAPLALLGLSLPLLGTQRPRGAAHSTGPAGSVQGEVKLAGSSPVPAPTRILNTTDPAVCGSTHVLEDWVVSRRNRGVQNVIVTIEGVGAADAARPASPARLVLDNRTCRFAPHASVLTAGSTVETVNSDPVLHTVHFYGPMDVNIALPRKDTRVSTRVDASGMLIVKCDVHGWMQAFIKVDSHPFHAVSNASGSFRIAEVPPGEYVLHAWHEHLGDHRVPVHVRPGEITKLTVTYPIRQK